MAQDAVVAALQQWPESGIPANPAGWLVTVAKRRHLDSLRRAATFDTKQGELYRRAIAAGSIEAAAADESLSSKEIEDDLLRLMFISCHPMLSPEARVALTLRLVGGLTTEEIARAYLVAEPTVAQRIVRAKKMLHDAAVPFELPGADERLRRLSSVLEVIYLVFNEGYVATRGSDWARPQLCSEALRLGRMLARLVPSESEVHGLVALMELQASRLQARVGPTGEPVLLGDQDRGRWDRGMIGRGLAALDRAVEHGPLGPYGLQAAIAAQHAKATSLDSTDWEAIASLYEILARVQPSPVVELNRAVAVGRSAGPLAGLWVLEAVDPSSAVARSHLYAGVRADFLQQLGRVDEARAEFERAASLTANEGERALLLSRASDAGRRVGG